MKIVLCDDQRNILEQLSELIRKFDVENNIQNELIYFDKPSKLFEYMQEEAIDLVFMDLDFCDESEDGISWIKKMKKQFPRTIVIILTAYEKRYKEGYEARAFRFMTKPIEEKELFDTYMLAWKSFSLQRVYL